MSDSVPPSGEPLFSNQEHCSSEEPDRSVPLHPDSPLASIVGLLYTLEDNFREARTLLEATEETFQRGEAQVRHALTLALGYTGWRDTSVPQFEGLIIGYSQIGACHLVSEVGGGATPPPKQPGVRVIGSPVPVARSGLRVRYLGPFVVEVNDRPIEQWHRGKAKALFKFLVIHRKQPIPRDVLIEALWPEADPKAAGNTLKVTVHALRQLINGSGSPWESGNCILFEEGFYRLNPHVDLWVDVEEFQGFWQAGQALERQGETKAAFHEFERAEALYCGDFLEEDLYEEWTQLTREHLKDIFLRVLTRLADQSLASGNYDGCIERCQRILERDNTREDVYRRLMLCYARLGQIGRARSWYKLCAEVLRRELDIEPDLETTSLYEQLKERLPV